MTRSPIFTEALQAHQRIWRVRSELDRAKASVLDDLERWHAGRGERLPALEARLERLRRLAAAVDGDGDATERAVLEARARDVARRERDLPWSAWASALLCCGDVAQRRSRR
jgi:hypothetical protein